MTLVEDAKRAWRWFSVQAMVVAGVIQGAWIIIPDDLRASLPHGLVSGITIALLMLGVAGRLVAQPGKPNEAGDVDGLPPETHHSDLTGLNKK